VMVVRKSYGTGILKFDDAMGVLLSEEALRKSSGSAEISDSALSVDRRGRPMNRDKKKNDKSKSKSGRGNFKSRGAGVGGAVRRGIFRGLQMSRRVMDLML